MVQKGIDKRKEEDLVKGKHCDGIYHSVSPLCCVAAFSEADKNHDGFLSMEEYVRVFKEHGVSITAEEVALYFASKVGYQSCLQTRYSINMSYNLIMSDDLS